MRYTILILGVFLAMMLAACESAAPGPIPETSAYKTTLPTFTSTLLPTRTNIPTPTWTRAASSTLSASPAKTRTFTPEPSNTLATSPVPTATEGPYAIQTLWAPNREFVAKRYFDNYSTSASTIEISDVKGSVLWVISDPRGEIEVDPHDYLEVYKWSHDSSVLYFYYAFNFDGPPTLYDGFDLQRIDIHTGQIKRVLPSEGLLAFAFSPDETFLAYSCYQDQPRSLIIRNLSNNAEIRIAIDLPVEDENSTQAGWINWAPDGNEIVYHTAVREMIRVVHLDIATMEQKEILEYIDGEYGFAGWAPYGGLMFISFPSYEEIEINIKTGEITTIGTVTPTP